MGVKCCFWRREKRKGRKERGEEKRRAEEGRVFWDIYVLNDLTVREQADTGRGWT